MDAYMFTQISIETITACNRRCSYCPNSIFDRSSVKYKKLMDDKLFYKIIDELAELNFKGKLIPHGYGEPLMDHRLSQLIIYSKTKLPEIEIVLHSNGDFLNVDKYKELVQAGVNHFSITQHGPKRSYGLDEVINYRKHNDFDNVGFSLAKFGKYTTLLNRGGLVDRQPFFKRRICFDPTGGVTVNYLGNVILCCNDYLGTIVFGTLKSQRLIDIWESKTYSRIRKECRRGIFNYEICRKCSGITKINKNTSKKAFVQISADQVEKLKGFIEYIELTREDICPESLYQVNTDTMKRIMDHIKAKLPGAIQGKILEVGCRQGQMLNIFKMEGHSPVGITLNKDDVIECTKKGLIAYEMDPSFLDFDDEQYDFLWCRHYLIQSIFPAYTLAEFFRVIRPGGYCYIEVPVVDSPQNHESDRNNFSVLGKKMWSALITRTGFLTIEVINLEGKGPNNLNDAYWGFVLERPSKTVHY